MYNDIDNRTENRIAKQNNLRMVIEKSLTFDFLAYLATFALNWTVYVNTRAM